ncbi:hypothetical protein D3C80_1306420 [compost metagenome]
MHRPRRVVTGDIERLEVVVVVFDFRTFGDVVADMGEELLDALKGASHRMQTAGDLTATRQGHVDAFGRQLGCQRGGLEVGLARIEGILNAGLGGIDQGARLRALIGRELAQGLHELGQLALLAKVMNPELLQGIHIFGVSHGLQGLGDQRIQVFHVQTPDTK